MKEFANPPTIDKVIAMVRVAQILTHGVWPSASRVPSPLSDTTASQIIDQSRVPLHPARRTTEAAATTLTGGQSPHENSSNDSFADAD